MKAKHHAEQTETGGTTISDESILKITKEIVVKFIEMGKITPAGFDTSFRNIHTTIETTVRKQEQ